MNTYSTIAILFPLFLIVVSFFDTTAWKSKRRYITKFPVYLFSYLLIVVFPNGMNFMEESIALDGLFDDSSSVKNENDAAEFYKKRSIGLNIFDFVYSIITGGLLFLFFCSGWVGLLIQHLGIFS